MHLGDTKPPDPVTVMLQNALTASNLVPATLIYAPASAHTNAISEQLADLSLPPDHYSANDTSSSGPNPDNSLRDATFGSSDIAAASAYDTPTLILIGIAALLFFGKKGR